MVLKLTALDWCTQMELVATYVLLKNLRSNKTKCSNSWWRICNRFTTNRLVRLRRIQWLRRNIYLRSLTSTERLVCSSFIVVLAYWLKLRVKEVAAIWYFNSLLCSDHVRLPYTGSMPTRQQWCQRRHVSRKWQFFRKKTSCKTCVINVTPLRKWWSGRTTKKSKITKLKLAKNPQQALSGAKAKNRDLIALYQRVRNNHLSRQLMP